MRGISEERLIKARNNTELYWDTRRAVDIVLRILPPIELDPWIPIDEFLKSEFEGLCWICLKGYPLTYARFSDGEFDKDDVLVNDKLITHVQPIHKPEPPR